ncbi:MAG: aminopeptidase P family protein [Actinomycetota bacterium]|nr:M24 family metallopeptidase [Euzebyaceae bacterium]MDQ3453719.1 aminopeptidase P family protein [Actinomycetota bacterium]
MTDHAARRARLAALADAAGLDLLFVPLGADLEYLTGLQRRVATFGEINYTHGWVAGAFLPAADDPVLVLPRMTAEFDLPEGADGEVVVVGEHDAAEAIFGEVARRWGPVRRLGIGARTWGETVIGLQTALGGPELVDAGPLVNHLRRIKAPDELAAMRRACAAADAAMAAVSSHAVAGVTERDLAEEVDHHLAAHGSRTPSFDTGVWAMGPDDQRDATVRVSGAPLRAGTGVSFDFGGVIDGYCSDFGRTVHIGEPPPEYRRVYDLVMTAQAAGIAATRPGVTAAQVDAATRVVIDDAGYGRWFRHRTGHCIGLDVHERPFISSEDDTPLEAGMTFTVEPSVFWPGRVGVRVEDIVVVTDAGASKLNSYPTDLVAT